MAGEWNFVEYLEARRRVETASPNFQARAQAFATEVLAENAAEQKYPTLDAMWDRVTVLAKESQP